MDSLFKAATYGDVEELQHLLNGNPDLLVDSAMVTANTPLHIAAANGHCEFVRMMLSSKPSLAWELNKDGFTAINLAAEKGHISIVKDLLLHDHRLCMLKDCEGRTALHCAGIHGRINIINELLMKFKDCLDEITARGETVLHLALKHDQEDAFVVLMNWVKETQKEKLLDLKDKAGSTVLELAQSKKKNKAIIQLVTGKQDSQKFDNEFGIKMVKLSKDYELEGTLFIGVLSILVLSLFFCVHFSSETTQHQAYMVYEFEVFFSDSEAHASENVDGIDFSFVPDADDQKWTLTKINFDQFNKEVVQLKIEMESIGEIEQEIRMELPQKEQVLSLRKIAGLDDLIIQVLLSALFFISVLAFVIIITEIIEKNIKPAISMMPLLKLTLSTIIMCFVWAATGPSFFFLFEDISTIVLIVAVISTFSLFSLTLKINKELEQRRLTERLLEDSGALSPVRFRLADLEKITNNFSTKLGDGGFGTVYKGHLKNGLPVAVKRLNNLLLSKEDYLSNEISTVASIRHKNVVRLLGICVDSPEQALVYEHVANGSLDMHIFSHDSAKLDWGSRYSIAMGLAKALHYLHEESNLGSIVHGDIKPQNILLDSNFTPKITAFGSSIFLAENRAFTGLEPWISEYATCKSDVYSFGVVLLEIVAGRRIDRGRTETETQDYLPTWLYKCLEKGEDLGTEEETAKKLAIVAFWCTQNDPADRPTMHHVIRMLEDRIENLPMPPNPFAFGNPIQNP